MKKAISSIEIQILLVFGVIALFGFSFLIKFIQENIWIVFLVILLIVIFLINAYFQSQEEKKCKKCFSKNTTLIYSNDKVIGWKYMTKKGYPDKRRKSNPTTYLLTKKFNCNDCKHIFKIESTYER